MSMVAERELEPIGETRGIENHDHDLVAELSRRLDALWRYDQYFANAGKNSDLQKLWQDLKHQDQENVKRLKKIIAHHVEVDCF